MTPEEVFAQLRDIHAPEAVGAASPSYDVRPVLLLVAAIATFIVFRAALRRFRRRRALRRIDPKAPMGAQRDALLGLLPDRRRRPRTASNPAPVAAFEPPDKLTRDGVAELRRWVGRRLG